MPKKNTLDRLYRYTDFATRRKAAYTETNYHLERMQALLASLGSPDKAYRILHVAGTKGKGSTSFYLAGLLKLSGERVGLYSSPHVLDERERISINGKNITWFQFEKYFDLIEKKARHLNLAPTVFEFFTLMAFLFFRDQQVTFAVIEVGLGGRLDSTNVVTPIAAVITPIHYDHMEKLGHTLTLIAGEKAGIIKQKIPVFSARQSLEAQKVLTQVAALNESPLQYLRKPLTTWKTLGLSFLQRDNFSLAYLVLKTLGVFKLPLSKALVAKLGSLPGRYQKWDRLLLDGAHNPFAIKHLTRAILEDKAFSQKKINVVFFCYPDKDLGKMVKLFPKAWSLYYFDLKLAYLEPKEHPSVNHYFSTRIANLTEFKTLYAHKSREVFVVTGSFTLVSYFLKHSKRVIKGE